MIDEKQAISNVMEYLLKHNKGGKSNDYQITYVKDVEIGWLISYKYRLEIPSFYLGSPQCFLVDKEEGNLYKQLGGFPIVFDEEVIQDFIDFQNGEESFMHWIKIT